MNRNSSIPIQPNETAGTGRRLAQWLVWSFLAVCWSAAAQQYRPPKPSSIDAKESKQQIIVTLSEEAMFRGTALDEATRAEIVGNLRGVKARALTIAQIDPGLLAHQVPAGNVLLPLDMTTLTDGCALPGVSTVELAAIGRLLQQRLSQSSKDMVEFEAHTPKGCPLKQLRYYSRSALLIAPAP